MRRCLLWGRVPKNMMKLRLSCEPGRCDKWLAQMPAKTKTRNRTMTTVGSHIAPVQFYGATVPVGFLGTFRKANCLRCSTDGFLHRAGGAGGVLCECAIRRAVREFQRVQVVAFEDQGKKWLEGAEVAVRANEAACEAEGERPGTDAPCPYPRGSDQNLAWTRGRARRDATSDLIVELDPAAERD